MSASSPLGSVGLASLPVSFSLPAGPIGSPAASVSPAISSPPVPSAPPVNPTQETAQQLLMLAMQLLDLII